MKILLTNDDGYSAPGILALHEALSARHDVILAAPDRERSAIGHAITLNQHLRLKTVRFNGGKKGYAVTGTPADCIKLGLFELYRTPPDLVVSGINPGSNTGVNINYSGTVGAAREAALNGVSSVAVSIIHGKKMDFQGMAGFIALMADKIHGTGLPAGTFLNINAPNIPVDDMLGVKITRQSANNLSTIFEKRTDPRNQPYYWYGNMVPTSSEMDTDDTALDENYISITPMQCDVTDYNTMKALEPLIVGQKDFCCQPNKP